MSQWQAGFQYPMQTGFPANNPQFQQQNPQFQQQNPQLQQNPQFQQQAAFAAPVLLPQSTGFPGQRPGGFQQPQQTGFQGVIQSQPTGFVPGNANFQPRQVPPPPVPPLPIQFQQQNPSTNLLGLPQQRTPVNHFQSTSSGGLMQPTGFPGRPGGPLVPQVTGYVDPRLQMMSSTFMPMNNASFGGGAPQLATPQFNLQQSIQQHNQAQRGTATMQMPWALSKAEKKQYNDIFRSWDAQNTGFISGQKALEVFGASGLPKEDLAHIWTLADIDDRGKLNIAEFHVAMGLIYRRLSGMPIPDQLPAELVPPSARDLNSSVDMMRDLLKNETRTRSPTSLDAPLSYAKVRSLTSSSSPSSSTIPVVESSRDATIYKHNDTALSGEFYKPRSRHINRDDVRARSEEDSPIADLEAMKRRLASAAQMLDQAAERSEADEALERELEELKYRVKRVSEDLEYVTSVSARGGGRERDTERRKLERELMELMHDRVPEVERRIRERDERREREKREWARERDRRNERFARFDERDRDRDRERPYSRGSYRDRERDRDERDRDRVRDDDRSYRRARSPSSSAERDYSRNRSSPPRTRSPLAPPPASSLSLGSSRGSAPTPKPTSSPLKKMTHEERQAFAHAEAQKRIQERMVLLGVAPPASSSSTSVGSSSGSIATPGTGLDSLVEDRLIQEKREAEEKARIAEEKAEERERTRKERLDSEKKAKEVGSTSGPGPVSVPEVKEPVHGATVSAAAATATATPRVSPVLKRPPVPPPPRRSQNVQQAPALTPKQQQPMTVIASAVPTPPAVVTPPVPVVVASAPPVAITPLPAEDPEDETLRLKEEAIRKQKEARAEKLRQLEKEEEEARLEEERYSARVRALREKERNTPISAAVPTPPASVPPPVTAGEQAKSTNPFSRMIKMDGGAGAGIDSPAVATPTTNGPSAPASETNGSTNPWSRVQAQPASSIAPTTTTAATLTNVPTPTRSPAPTGPKSYHTAPGDTDSDWEDIKEKDDDENSSDEDIGRGGRADLARQLFGSILPTPVSTSENAAGGKITSHETPTHTTGPEFVAPPPPVAPLPPVAPPQPPTTTQSLVTATGPGDVNALMRSIQGGMRLKPVQTIDKSRPPVSGRVLGDSAPPAHINVGDKPDSSFFASISTSQPQTPTQMQTKSVLSPPIVPSPEDHEQLIKTPDMKNEVEDRRQSVGWFTERAADAGMGAVDEVHRLPSMKEEEEPEPAPAPVPTIQIDEVAQESAFDTLYDIDKSVEYRARSLYAYHGDGPDDLSFAENLILTAHPSKTGGDWWYGTLVSSRKSGLFPKTYVDVVKTSKAKALYSYINSNPDELPFTEGDELTIIDKSEQEWWKAEQEGVVFIVPAAYLEVIEDPALASTQEVKMLAMTKERPDSSIYVADSQVTVDDSPKVRASLNRDESDGEDDSDTSDYFSANGSDEDDDGYPEHKVEREARAHERQMVLEAAGLIVKQDDKKPPPRPARSRSIKHRPAPAAPQRTKQLPPLPDHEPEPKTESDHIDHATRLDDAFDRYEAFKNSQSNRMSIASSIDTDQANKRMSIASMETLTLSPLMSTNSKEGDNGRGYSHFLHFLSRSKTPEGEPSKKTLSISSPMMVQSPSLEGLSTSRSESSAFGTSWASLVDKAALEGIPAGERRRQEAIFELINTESAYVRDLQLIVEKFYSTMVPLLSQKEVTVIFANIEDILLINTAFLSSLEDRQKECRLYIDGVGDILLDHTANMAVYMAYCVNQATAIKVLKSLRDSNAELEALLRHLRDDDPDVRNLDLSSYLLVPMQRITRYPLLLKQILNHTDLEVERDGIRRSVEVVEKILGQINETIRDQEGWETLKSISQHLWIDQGRLDLTAPTRYMGARKLLKEGALTKAKSGRKLHAFLCSDILVLTDKLTKTLYRMPIPLAHAQVKDAGRDDLTFQVSQAYPRGGDTISLRAPSTRDCQLWIQEIDCAGRRCRRAEDRAIRKRRK